MIFVAHCALNISVSAYKNTAFLLNNHACLRPVLESRMKERISDLPDARMVGKSFLICRHAYNFKTKDPFVRRTAWPSG